MDKTQQIEVMASAIANARGMRRGVPMITNVLDVLPRHVKAEIFEDAEAALDAKTFRGRTRERIRRRNSIVKSPYIKEIKRALELAIVVTVLIIIAVLIDLARTPKQQIIKSCEERGMQSGVVYGTGRRECFTTGNRFDSGGRLNANGAYVLDRDGRPVLAKDNISRR